MRKSSAELVGESFGFPVVDGDYSEVDIPQGTKETLVAQMRVSQIQWQGTNAYLVSLRDITQLKQAQEERVELLKEAQAANRAKDEFFSDFISRTEDSPQSNCRLVTTAIYGQSF